MLGVNKPALLFAGVILFALAFLGVLATGTEVSASSSATLLADWQRYTAKDEEFSATLPVMPAMTTQTTIIPKLKKERRERLIGAYADGVVYAIYTFENPKRRQSLDEFITEFYRNSVPSGSRDLSLGGFKGKEFSFELDGRKGVTQFYITEQNVYRFMAMGSTIINPDDAMAKFFSSIKIEKHPGGAEIVDGPGEQAAVDPAGATARIFTGKEVTRKAIVFTKPEPRYTEEARQNQVTGTVVLRGTFTASGAVTNIKAVSVLPYGLTERALAAARQIKFIPAIKDGQFVSMYIQLEYNFNLY